MRGGGFLVNNDKDDNNLDDNVTPTAPPLAESARPNVWWCSHAFPEILGFPILMLFGIYFGDGELGINVRLEVVQVFPAMTNRQF